MNLTTFAALTFFANAATAQNGVPLDRYEPTAPGDHLFASPDTAIDGDMVPTAALTFSYAKNPLVLVQQGSTEQLGRVVTDQLTLHGQFGIQLKRRLFVDLNLPLTALQDGEDLTRGNAIFSAPQDAAINDVRVGARLALLESDGAIPGASVGFRLWLPTGDPDQLTGGDVVRYGASVIVGADTPSYVWSASVGRRRQQNIGLDGLLGSDVSFTAGIAAKLGMFQIGPELFGSTVANSKIEAFTRRGSRAEVLLGGKYRFGPFTAGLAAGPGLTRGVGTPAFRVIGQFAYAPERKKPEVSAEPQVVKRDRTVTQLGGGIGGEAVGGAGGAVALAADGDEDGDGVLNSADACPRVVGPNSGAKPGCPPDQDGDGIVDSDDKCPNEPGVPSDDPAEYGCAVDTDGDGIKDPADACPRAQGPKAKDPKKHGCPTSVTVTGKQIVIAQNIKFATAKDTIQPESFPILQQVATLMNDRPEITRVAVDGHTDNVGREKNNLSLSQRRAVAVIRWLIAHGVDERRLEARGYGPRRPIADNKTAEGRAKNRRVEFQILKQSPKGKAAWKDGPVVQ